MTRVKNGRRRCCRGRRPTFRAQLRRVALVSALPVLLTTLSCGGDGSTPSAPSGPAPAPPVVPRPPEPTRADLTVDPTSVREDAGATTLTVTATLVGEGTRTTATAIALTVDDGTATAAEHTATQANLMIAAGRTSGTATLTLTPVSDAVLEGAETVTVNGTAAGLTVQGVEVTINDPPVVVFFSMDRLEVPEGKSRDVIVHYQVADLATPLNLGISFLAGSASEADFETSAESVRIPAGRLMSGQVEVSLAARTDRTVTEGAETLTVRFIPPAGIEGSLVALGQDLEVVILDRGRPCPGVTVWGDPPEWRNSVTRATLFIEWENGSNVGFDWAGPYYDDEEDPENRSGSPLLEVNIAEWRVETMNGVTRHTLEVEWPPFLQAGLIFRSEKGACGLPTLTCATSGCELGP